MDQQGTWDWPSTGTWPPEIDIFEVLGKDITTLYQTVHTGTANTSNGKATTVADMSLGFHTYGVDWQNDFTVFYFDGLEVFRQATPPDCHKPMFMILNLALGSTWGGVVDATTPFPAKMLVDYVRVYKAGTVIPAPAPVSAFGTVLTAFVDYAITTPAAEKIVELKKQVTRLGG
jgi:beta-glucanase (GH16 family)